MPSNPEICIVGTGIIGKTAALAFAQAGLRVMLIGPRVAAEPPSDWDVRVYALNHVAHDVLDSLRVWGALNAQRIAPVRAMHVQGDGDPTAGLQFDAYGARVDTLAWIVEDGNLNAALDAALRFASNIEFVDSRAQCLRYDADCVRLELEGSAAIHAQLVVGADGAQSWVRHQAGIGIDYRSYRQRAVVANFACEKPHHGTAYQWFAGEQGIVALLPLPGDQVSLVWSAPDALAASLRAAPQAALAERLAAFAHEPLGRLTPLQPEVCKDFPLALIRPHQITAPRIALIGDAAHVVHPLAGHGMNLGFADVAALVERVSARGAHVDCGDEQVLQRYARDRKEDILLMQLTTDGLARLFGSELGAVRSLRNLGLHFVNRLPGMKRRLIAHALGKS